MRDIACLGYFFDREEGADLNDFTAFSSSFAISSSRLRAEKGKSF